MSRTELQTDEQRANITDAVNVRIANDTTYDRENYTE